MLSRKFWTCVLPFLALPIAASQVSVPIDATGAGPLQELDRPGGFDRAPDGSLWVPGYYSHNLFRVDAGGDVQEVFSIWPELREAAGVAVRPDGAIFVTSHGTDAVVRVDPDGSIEPAMDETGAGPGQLLDGPREIAADAAGNVYVAARWSNNVLRIAPNGSVAQVIGPEGAGPAAPLVDARDVAVDAAGVVYVAGMGSDNVLALEPGGSVAELVGPAGDGLGTPVSGATALAVTPDGTLYVASLFEHAVLRRSPGGAIDVVVGPDGDGLGNPLSFPLDLTLAPDGTLYVASKGNDTVLGRAPDGTVSLVADFSGDGAGHLLNDPTDLLVGPDGALHIACATSENVFRVDAGVVSWVADVPGFGSGGTAAGEGALAFDAAGALLVSGWDNDQVVRLDAGGPTLIVDDSGGPGSAFANPYRLRVDAAGSAYVASYPGYVFRFDDASGSFELVVDPSGDGEGNGLSDPEDLLFDPQGRLVVVGRGSDNILRVEPDGTVVELLGAGSPINGPTEAAFGPDGSLYIANTSAHNIVALRPDGSAEVLLGWQDVHPENPPTGSAAWYVIDVDTLGRAYIAGPIFGEVWRLDPDGELTLVWVQTVGENPGDVAVDAGGAVYVAASHNEAYVYRIEPSGATTAVLTPAGDGAGHPLDDPDYLRVDGPGRFEVASTGSDAVFSVDLGFCGGWTLLPGALPADGSAPLLTGEGALCAGEPWLIRYTEGRPDAPGTLFVGLGELSAPFKGGTLIPHPDLIVPVQLDGDGAFSLSGTWPAGTPSGASLWLQVWVPEPPTTPGYRASNGLRIDLL